MIEKRILPELAEVVDSKALLLEGVVRAEAEFGSTM